MRKNHRRAPLSSNAVCLDGTSDQAHLKSTGGPLHGQIHAPSSHWPKGQPLLLQPLSEWPPRREGLAAHPFSEDRCCWLPAALSQVSEFGVPAFTHRTDLLQNCQCITTGDREGASMHWIWFSCILLGITKAVIILHSQMILFKKILKLWLKR